jgi:HEAT repeat protein
MRTKAHICLTVALLAAGAVFWLQVKESIRPSTRGSAGGPPTAQEALTTASDQPATATPPSPAPSPLLNSQLSTLNSSSVPDAIRPILGLSQESSAVRWAAVRALGPRLNQAERTALFDYLRGHEEDAAGPMRGVLKNDVILALKHQEPPPKELAGVLLGMFHDQEQDPVIRNYALQHLATWYEQAAEKPKVLDALWAGITDADASIQGTALIGMSRLATRQTGFQTASEIDRARLTTVALSAATDSSRPDTARLSALQVCAELGIQDVLATAMSLAESGASVPLRMSAVAAVGALGAGDQAAFLNRLLSSEDTRIQTAARAALRQLEARKNG